MEVKIISKIGKEEPQSRSNWKTMYYFLQLSRFGAIELVPRGHTLNQNAACPFKESTRSRKKLPEHCRLLYISSHPEVSRGKQNSCGSIDIVCPCLSAADITLFKKLQISCKTTIWINISSTRKTIKSPNPAFSKSRTECWETCERLWNRCTNVGRGCFKRCNV
jgi:hypothetical protein